TAFIHRQYREKFRTDFPGSNSISEIEDRSTSGHIRLLAKLLKPHGVAYLSTDIVDVPHFPRLGPLLARRLFTEMIRFWTEAARAGVVSAEIPDALHQVGPGG